MSTLRRLALAGALMGLGALGGCTPERGVMPVRTERLIVDAQTVTCQILVEQTCLRVRASGSDVWENFYGPIEGFTHEPGWVTEIEVEIFPRGGEPVMDASDRLYRLKRVLGRWQPCVGCAFSASTGR